MDRVSKVHFDPLLSTAAQISSYLLTLAPGHAHPFHPKKQLLLHHPQGQIQPIDISAHAESYFANSVNLSALGDSVLERLALFPALSAFHTSYTITQAPGSSFTVPLPSPSSDNANAITIFALSKRDPTFYDLCVADARHNTSCYAALTTFPGFTHSGDINSGSVLLHHLTFAPALIEKRKEFVLFVSGYSHTQLTRYKKENPLVLVVDHGAKVMYVVPVPLDAASIGEAILCCPLVVRVERGEGGREAVLRCEVLAKPATDDHLMCSGNRLNSPAFEVALHRADFSAPIAGSMVGDGGQSGGDVHADVEDDMEMGEATTASEGTLGPGKARVVLATRRVSLADIPDLDGRQVIRFGNGIDWVTSDPLEPRTGCSLSVLPCILGGVLEGPLLLATGETPTDLPFTTEKDLHRFYRHAESVVVVVDDTMTDNARNLATSWRINGLIIIQVASQKAAAPDEDIAMSTDEPAIGRTTEDSAIVAQLEDLNINSITALAGPQSLVVAQIGQSYYFYRGVANPSYLDTTTLKFGQDITDFIRATPAEKLLGPKWPRLVNLAQKNHIYLPVSGREITPEELKNVFENAPLEEMRRFKSDILAVLPQLQVLLSQKDLETLCGALLSTIQAKIHTAIATEKDAYVHFLTHEYVVGDPVLQKRKNASLASLRKKTREAQESTAWLIQAMGNLLSAQTTSTRGHDLKRLLRQNAIRGNVEAVKSMTFEKLGGLLEEHAQEMGVLLVNVDTGAYERLLAETAPGVQAAGQACVLDRRVLHLEGFDAGIILEQGQASHNGPLVSQFGPAHPILALPYLSPAAGTGSMLAWVCWDEFVELEDPYAVRWVEKCNDSHIAALRIMMRGTLSEAASGRERNLGVGSVETGQLMGALLMATMGKLAAMRTTAPGVVEGKAEDTSTKLMRGLFGHLLTVAGSGTRPLSLVWQLCGTNPQLDVPSDDMAWSWYEQVAKLFPYTGWPAGAFNKNLEDLLDKAIFRLLTTSKKGDTVSSSAHRAAQFQSRCKARNVQLAHSRTIVMALAKILDADEEYRHGMAANLLKLVPKNVENQTRSYSRLHAYVEHLAAGGAPKAWENLVAANVFTRRSAVVRELKTGLTTAVKSGDNVQVHDLCGKIVRKREEVAKTWEVDVEKVKMQGLNHVVQLLEVEGERVMAVDGKEKKDEDVLKDLHMRVKGDAEQHREPWILGKGEFGTLAPLDMELLEAALRSMAPLDSIIGSTAVVVSSSTATEHAKDSWARFEKLARPDFLKKMERLETVADVCALLRMPVSMLGVFEGVIAPGQGVEGVPARFREVVFALLESPGQEGKRPGRGLWGVGKLAA